MKETDKLTKVIANFDIELNIAAISPFGHGHINDTYFVESVGSSSNFLLQKINHDIFKNIDNLIRNILLITSYLRVQVKVLGYGNEEQSILRLVPGTDGAYYYKDEENQYWRIYYFLDNTRSYDTISTAKQAFEGGKAFGRFQAMLSDLPTGLLSETIPNFLNMEKRLENFMQSVALNEHGRVAAVQDQIDFILERAKEMCYFQQPAHSKRLTLRAVHNDTKFNNVLLDQHDEAQCVIDLDTVMPGYVAYDFGDSIRTIINTAAEDEADLSLINLNVPLFNAYTEGYFQEATFLTHAEVSSLMRGVMLMPYMQAVRFLTDYLEGDHYYKIAFEKHNLQRTNAQLQLLRKLEENSGELSDIIQRLKESNTK